MIAIYALRKRLMKEGNCVLSWIAIMANACFDEALAAKTKTLPIHPLVQAGTANGL